MNLKRPKSVETQTSLSGKLTQHLSGALFGMPENRVYGAQSILNAYAGVSGRFLRGRLQHGWPALTPSYLYYQNDLLPTYLWSRTSQVAASNQGWDNFHGIGAPWIYLMQLINRDGWEFSCSSSGSLSATTLWVYARHSLEASGTHRQSLLTFIKKAHEVCDPGDYLLLYFTDFDLLTLEDKEKFPKLRIVTLGERSSSMLAEAHLLRLFELLQHIERIVLDHPSTIVLYALFLKKKVEWIRNDNWYEALRIAQSLNLESTLKLLVSSIEDPSAVRETVLDLLGNDLILTPDQMCDLFGWNQGKFESLRNVGSGLVDLSKFAVKLLSYSKNN
jgi:hypothetical protein